MLNWLGVNGHKILVVLIAIERLDERLGPEKERFLKWLKMGGSKMQKWEDVLKLVPELEGIVGDVEAVDAEASQSPAVQKLVSDLKVLIANAKAVA